MEHIVGLVKHHGIDEVVATLAFMPQVIEDYFGDGEEWGMNISYALEETPMGTATATAPMVTRALPTKIARAPNSAG